MLDVVWKSVCVTERKSFKYAERTNVWMKRKCALTVGYYKRFVAVSIHIKCKNFSTVLAHVESFIKAYDGCYQRRVWWTSESDLSRTKCNETRSILWQWSSLELELITSYSSTGLSTSYIVYTNLMTIIIVINIIITHADWLTKWGMLSPSLWPVVCGLALCLQGCAP